MNNVYDIAFRSMVTLSKRLLIPLVNEMFHYHFTMGDKVELLTNNHFFKDNEGVTSERISDTIFTIEETKTGIKRLFHLECQSTVDKSITYRVVEYDFRTGLENAEHEDYDMKIDMPLSAIIALRSDSKTPDRSVVNYSIGDQNITSEIPVLKIADYTIDELFEKELYILIPFYIFTHEKDFSVYNNDTEELRSLMHEQIAIVERLNQLEESGKLSVYEKQTLVDNMKAVLDFITQNHEDLNRKAGEVMRGPIFVTETTKVYEKGIEQGEENKAKAIAVKMKQQGMDSDTISEFTGLSADEINGL